MKITMNKLKRAAKMEEAQEKGAVLNRKQKRFLEAAAKKA